MNIKNIKAFTLVELLGAIVILALLSLVAIPAVTKTVKANKQKLYDIQLENIRSSAKAWGSENISRLPSSGCAYITLGSLKKYGFVDDDVKDPRDDSLLNDAIAVTITVNNDNYDYEVNKNTTSCTEIKYVKIIKFKVYEYYDANSMYNNYYTYEAEDGMTFNDWVNSSYNVDGFFINGNSVCVNNYILDSIQPTDVISPTVKYDLGQ